MDMSDKKFWGDKPYFSLDHYLKQTFGEKVYRLSLNGGMTETGMVGGEGVEGIRGVWGW